MIRVLRVIGVVPLPRNCRRSTTGSSWPRTLASPLIHCFAPGTRVRAPGTLNTSRVSSRATRYSSPAMRMATPTHSRPDDVSVATCADSARPRRSSSARSSKGRSRRLLSDTPSVTARQPASVAWAFATS